MPVRFVKTSSALADTVRRLFSARGLSLADLSRESQKFGNRLAHIPHSFYSSLQNRSFTASLYQLHSLSRLSGYRLVDWLALFGFSLDDVSRFQMLFPSFRTVELDATVYRPAVPLPHLYDLQEADLATPLAPLSQWVALGLPRPIKTLLRNTKNSFRYLKIGSHDALAFPDLLPGSVVRVKEGSSILERAAIGKRADRSLFLVLHNRGITCSRLLRANREKIVLCSRQLPYAPIELTAGTEAVVLGRVDLEFRPLATVAKPVVSAQLERYRVPHPLGQTTPPRDVGEFIQRSRRACGISFRDASSRTRVIARQLADRRYYCSPSALSDYETRKSAPRRIHKLISICAVYFASAARLLEVCGTPLSTAGERPMPSDILNVFDPHAPSPKRSRFLRKMERRFGPLPLFLRTAGYALFGLPNVSPRDLFWVGNARGPKHSCLAGARFLVVDRRQKRPKASLSSPSWAQPIFVLQRRSSGYLWGFCRLENGTLAFYNPAPHTKVMRFRNRVDAEVIGRVVGIIRKVT
jgi:transcriptional regulator with XRE-family HTH domain